MAMCTLYPPVTQLTALAPNVLWERRFASLGIADIGATSPRHGCRGLCARAHTRACTLLHALPARKRLQPASPLADLRPSARSLLPLRALRAGARRALAPRLMGRHPLACATRRFGMMSFRMKGRAPLRVSHGDAELGQSPLSCSGGALLIRDTCVAVKGLVTRTFQKEIRRMRQLWAAPTSADPAAGGWGGDVRCQCGHETVIAADRPEFGCFCRIIECRSFRLLLLLLPSGQADLKAPGPRHPTCRAGSVVHAGACPVAPGVRSILGRPRPTVTGRAPTQGNSESPH